MIDIYNIYDTNFVSSRIRDFIKNLEDKGLTASSKPINPRQLGDYILLETIGAAGQAIVYKAQHKENGKLSAIKIPRNSTLDDHKNWDRFTRGTMIAYRLTHTHNSSNNSSNRSRVVEITEVRLKEDEPEPFFVMEHLDGYDLKRIIDFVKLHQGRIPLDVSLFIAIEVCKSLKEIHEYIDPEYGGPIIHRDVKPSNIMISKRGEVKLMDLQIARGEAEGEVPTTQAFIAFLSYSPPEMINPIEFGKSEPSSDLYSATVILYEMLTNRLPFGNDRYTGAKIAAGNYAKVSEIIKKPLYSNLNKAIDSIINLGMHKDKDKRYQSASQMIRDLAQLYEDIEYGNRRYRGSFCLAPISWIVNKKRYMIPVAILFLNLLTGMAIFNYKPARPLGIWSEIPGFRATLDSKRELQTDGQILIFKEVSQGKHTISVKLLNEIPIRQERLVYVDNNGAAANFYFDKKFAKP